MTIYTQDDVELTAQQIASDIERLREAQKQNPSLVRKVLPSPEESYFKLDLILNEHVEHFADAVRRSGGATRGRH